MINSGANYPQRGFTLIEMITVLVILGLLSVAVLPRFMQTSNSESRTTADQLISILRHAQQLAMSKANNANVRVITDNGARRLRLSYTEGVLQIMDTALADSITINNTAVSFLKSGDASLASTLIITINPGARRVCVEPTGYAHSC